MHSRYIGLAPLISFQHKKFCTHESLYYRMWPVNQKTQSSFPLLSLFLWWRARINFARRRRYAVLDSGRVGEMGFGANSFFFLLSFTINKSGCTKNQILKWGKTKVTKMAYSLSLPKCMLSCKFSNNSQRSQVQDISTCSTSKWRHSTPLSPLAA